MNFEVKKIRDREFYVYHENDRSYLNYTKLIKNEFNKKPADLFNSIKTLIEILDMIIEKNIETKSQIENCKDLKKRLSKKKNYKTGIKDCCDTEVFKCFGDEVDNIYRGTYGPYYLIDFFLQKYNTSYKLEIHELLEGIQKRCEYLNKNFKDEIKLQTSVLKYTNKNDNRVENMCKIIQNATSLLAHQNSHLQFKDQEINELETTLKHTITSNNEEHLENSEKITTLKEKYNLTQSELTLILNSQFIFNSLTKSNIQINRSDLIVIKGDKKLRLKKEHIYLTNNKYAFILEDGTYINDKEELPWYKNN